MPRTCERVQKVAMHICHVDVEDKYTVRGMIRCVCMLCMGAVCLYR